MSGGGSTSSGDNRFERRGSASTTSYRDINSDHTNRFNTALDAVKPGSANNSIDDMLKGRIRGNPSDRPYASDVCNIVKSNLPGVGTPAQGAMTAQANINPMSDTYERNTYNRYAEEVQKAMGVARSGPAMTRGGTAAQGFAQAQAANDLGMNREQVLAQHRAVDGQLSQGAAGVLTQGRQAMNSSAINAIGQGQQGYGQFIQNMLASAGLSSERTKMYNDLVPAYATLSSPMHGTEHNDLNGRGSQTSTSFGAGVNFCCFIFMEAYNGELPAHVRACRDEFAPESTDRRKGYIWMSRWLVPAMRASGLVRVLTNRLLILPLTRWGAWYKQVPGGKLHKRDALAKNTWFTVWNLIGKVVK